MSYNFSKNKVDDSNISPASKVKNVLSSMAVEDMYFSDDFIEKVVKVANGELSSEELRQDILEQYTNRK